MKLAQTLVDGISKQNNGRNITKSYSNYRLGGRYVSPHKRLTEARTDLQAPPGNKLLLLLLL
jgi:hypothetical protein